MPKMSVVIERIFSGIVVTIEIENIHISYDFVVSYTIPYFYDYHLEKYFKCRCVLSKEIHFSCTIEHLS